MTAATTRSRRAALLVAVFTVLWAVFGTWGTAAAHTDFESSAPADGDVVDGPLAEVVVDFTNPATPAGDGFELVEPSGVVRTPTSLDETDGTSFVLTFDPPLEAGVYGLRWSVRAGDAHPIEGAFRFEVSDTTGTTVAPAGDAATPPTSVVPADGAAGGDTSDMAGMDAATHAAMADEALDALLAGSSSDDAVTVGRVGRTVTMLGTLFGIGVLAALIWTVRGRRDELHAQLGWIRLAGWVVFAGGLIELASLLESDASLGVGEALSTKAGVAAALKMAGGLAVVFGFHRRSGRIVAPAHSLSAAVAAGTWQDGIAGVPPAALHEPSGDGHRWTPTASAALGLGGYAAVLASFWFDGHTVSKGPWAIHSIVNLVHLAAAAVWVGGVFAMTTVVWMRHRRTERTGLAAMVVRFSSIATISLAAMVAAGLVMAWMILDAPGDLFGTSWGRILLVKTAAVAVAAGLGAFNHFRLRPALEQRPDDPALARELRTSLSIESAVLVGVVVLTAFLVAAAT